jgi:hypothetical protein
MNGLSIMENGRNEVRGPTWLFIYAKVSPFLAVSPRFKLRSNRPTASLLLAGPTLSKFAQYLLARYFHPRSGHCLCAPARAESLAVSRIRKCPSLVIDKASLYRTATREQSAFG